MTIFTNQEESKNSSRLIMKAKTEKHRQRRKRKTAKKLQHRTRNSLCWALFRTQNHRRRVELQFLRPNLCFKFSASKCTEFILKFHGPLRHPPLINQAVHKSEGETRNEKFATPNPNVSTRATYILILSLQVIFYDINIHKCCIDVYIYIYIYIYIFMIPAREPKTQAKPGYAALL